MTYSSPESVTFRERVFAGPVPAPLRAPATAWSARFPGPCPLRSRARAHLMGLRFSL